MKATISVESAIEQLSICGAIAASAAPAAVCDHPGLYAIFVTTPGVLPEPFKSALLKRDSRLLYIGRARDSLRVRLIEQELQHKRPATFFRGLGAILGFRPVPGSLVGKANQNNYRFSPADTVAIIRWMNEHLMVRWVAMDVDVLTKVEPIIIERLRPLLNTTHNPEKSTELAALREQCRKIACAVAQ